MFEGRRRKAVVGFGKTAQDYDKYRAGFPDAFFQRLQDHGAVVAGQRVLDLGTGTGNVARGLMARGCRVTGLDPSRKLLNVAASHNGARARGVDYVQGVSEQTGLRTSSFDAVIAGQCWHWFDRPRAALEVRRVLKPGGMIIIGHFDWLPMPGNVVDATEQLILKHNRRWSMSGGRGLYPQWLTDVAIAGFADIESWTFDVVVPYGHEAWRGRIRASNGVGVTLSPKKVAAFDEEHRRMLAERFPKEPLDVPHRVFVVTARSPSPML